MGKLCASSATEIDTENKMSNILCYTVITGEKDTPVPQDYPITVLSDYDKFKDPRRNSRIQKILSHKYFDSEYTIYMDGNMRLLISPEEVVKRYMDGVDIAFFKHGRRDCIYDEAIEVAKQKMDDIELIIEQAKHYEDAEYAKHKGLLQGGFIIRRYNERVKRFEEAWWADYCRYSRRDQLSLMPAIERSGVIVHSIPQHWRILPNGTAVMGDIVQMMVHNNLEGNFNNPKK